MATLAFIVQSTIDKNIVEIMASVYYNIQYSMDKNVVSCKNLRPLVKMH